MWNLLPQRSHFACGRKLPGHIAIHIPAEVIGNLGTESLVAFKRVPRRGLETGGILLGRTEFRDDTTTFWIEGFAPIESEHRFGPSYVLSDSDFAHLQTELTRNGAASLGIYRSQTRSEQLAIQDADVGLFEKCFGVSDNLFLMLAPVPRIGAFYFREDGNLKCVHQFDLVSSLSILSRRTAVLPRLTSACMHHRPKECTVCMRILPGAPRIRRARYSSPIRVRIKRRPRERFRQSTGELKSCHPRTRARACPP